MLGSAQPDLVYPVRCLTGLNADCVISIMLQYNGYGIIRISGPAIDAGRVNVQPVTHPGTAGPGSNLVIHLEPDGIRIAVVYVGFAS